MRLSASIDPQVHCSASDCAIFLEKILADGDFGSDTQRKIVAPVLADRQAAGDRFVLVSMAAGRFLKQF